MAKGFFFLFSERMLREKNKENLEKEAAGLNTAELYEKASFECISVAGDI